MNCIGQPIFGFVVGFAMLGVYYLYLLLIDLWRTWRAERAAKR